MKVELEYNAQARKHTEESANELYLAQSASSSRKAAQSFTKLAKEFAEVAIQNTVAKRIERRERTKQQREQAEVDLLQRREQLQRVLEQRCAEIAELEMQTAKQNELSDEMASNEATLKSLQSELDEIERDTLALQASEAQLEQAQKTEALASLQEQIERTTHECSVLESQRQRLLRDRTLLQERVSSMRERAAQ